MLSGTWARLGTSPIKLGSVGRIETDLVQNENHKDS
jgi:hypothetical protein